MHTFPTFLSKDPSARSGGRHRKALDKVMRVGKSNLDKLFTGILSYLNTVGYSATYSPPAFLVSLSRLC